VRSRARSGKFLVQATATLRNSIPKARADDNLLGSTVATTSPHATSDRDAGYRYQSTESLARDVDQLRHFARNYK
jgi:hypothetical protein